MREPASRTRLSDDHRGCRRREGTRHGRTSTTAGCAAPKGRTLRLDSRRDRLRSRHRRGRRRHSATQRGLHGATRGRADHRLRTPGDQRRLRHRNRGRDCQITVNDACIRAINASQDAYQAITELGDAAKQFDIARLDAIIRRLQPIQTNLQNDIAACNITTKVSASAPSTSPTTR